VFQELFSKQKGYLDEELDYRKQALDQAHKVRAVADIYQLVHPSGHLGDLCGQAQNLQEAPGLCGGHSLPV
jgi:hypothetical protein